MSGVFHIHIFAMELLSPENLAAYVVTGVFTIINLLVTYFVVKRFLFKPAMKFLKKRQDGIATDINEAKEGKKAAQALLSEAKAKIDASSQEAGSIVEEARLRGERQGEELIAEAKVKSSQLLAKARDDADRMKKTATDEMRGEIADISMAIASKIVGASMDDSQRRDLVNQFIDEELAAGE